MKKAFAAALTLSLLAGTSAFAQERHERGDRHGRADHQQQDEQRPKEDRRQRQDRRPAREQSEETRPARPVPLVSNDRGREAITQARARQREHDAVVVERRDDRANDAIAQARARRDDDQRTVERRHVVPRVIQQTEQRRVERRDGDNREQRIYIRPQTRTDSTASRRAEVERRLRDTDRNRDRGDHRWTRQGDGRQLRDRDRNRHWYTPTQWRRSYWAQHRYRAPYRYPSGWYVRTWIFGDYLPHGWYAQNYYLDWWRYGLPMPPIGAEWVRVGEDALLVDTWSGEVLSVYYDLFW
jgi:hypothetical protein